MEYVQSVQHFLSSNPRASSQFKPWDLRFCLPSFDSQKSPNFVRPSGVPNWESLSNFDVDPSQNEMCRLEFQSTFPTSWNPDRIWSQTTIFYKDIESQIDLHSNEQSLTPERIGTEKQDLVK